MDDVVLQEVNIIADSMANSKAKLKQNNSWKKELKIFVAVIVLLAFIIVWLNIIIELNGYIKEHGFDLAAITVTLAMMKLLLEPNVPENYYIMHHVKNDTNVSFIIPALQEEATNRNMHIKSIDIVEHKCKTYLQIRY